jgi:hypothetical protein
VVKSWPTVKAETIANSFRGYGFHSGPEVPASTYEECLTILDVTNGSAFVNIDENASCFAEHDDSEDDSVSDIVAMRPRLGDVVDEEPGTLPKGTHVRSQALGEQPSPLLY